MATVALYLPVCLPSPLSVTFSVISLPLFLSLSLILYISLYLSEKQCQKYEDEREKKILNPPGQSVGIFRGAQRLGMSKLNHSLSFVFVHYFNISPKPCRLEFLQLFTFIIIFTRSTAFKLGINLKTEALTEPARMRWLRSGLNEAKTFAQAN